MKLILKEEYNPSFRLQVIRGVYQNLGAELYELCQGHKKIDGKLKARLTRKVCNEFTRQMVVTRVASFKKGTFEFGVNEYNAIELASFISKMSTTEYEQYVDEIIKLEKAYDKKIEGRIVGLSAK